ncbi:MAG: MBG domain-containing protein, partial [Acetatifactor sp.]|nr:MBG domain-containing protein [Acetatifactor sp.]
MNNIQVTINCSDSTCLTDAGKQYDAQSVTLSASVTGIEKNTEEDSITFAYQWYRSADNNTWTVIDEEAGKDGEYSVRNVTQSGYYKVEVVVTVGDTPSSPATGTLGNMVKITKKPLTISVAEEKTITYGSKLPTEISEYTFLYDGLISGDEQSVLHNGQAAVSSSDYTLSSPAGVKAYSLTPEGFVSENYAITTTTSKLLTVKPYDASAFQVTLAENAYVFDGQEKKPQITSIKDGDKELFGSLSGGETEQSGNDYVVSYDDPVNAGERHVTLSFRGNYTGEISVPYTIQKAAYVASVKISNWKYGEYTEDKAPQVIPSKEENEPHIVIDSKKIHYIFKTIREDGTESEEYDEFPVNAGKYKIKARIDELDNYSAKETDWTAFEIYKRTIILKTDSYQWTYDGNAHSSSEKTDNPVSEVGQYTIGDITYTFDGFAGSDSYAQTPSAPVIVTDVTGEAGVENKIEYSFTSSTVDDNYHVILLEGKLTVIPQTLPAPSGLKWSTSKAGTATWVGVTKSGLQVAYYVTLKKGDEVISPEQGSDFYNASVPEVFVSTATSIDFNEVIKSACQSGIGLGTFTFSVCAVPNGGASVANYKQSVSSAESVGLHTAKLTVDKTKEGIASVSVDKKDSSIILEGESLPVTMMPADGYEEESTVWRVVNMGDDSETDCVVFGDTTLKDTTVKLKSGVQDNGAYKLVACAKDVAPYIAWSFSEDYNGEIKDEHENSYAQDMTRIRINVTMTDGIGVTKYRVVRVDRESAFVQSAYHNTTDEAWVSIDAGNQKAFCAVETITEKGVYYFGVVDTSGTISWTDPCVVYGVSFENGDVPEEKAGGSMSSILKVKDYDIKELPENQFTYDGYGFTEWKLKGSEKVYVNKGSYSQNSDAILVAKWSNEKCSYQVNYYLMNVDGSTYPDAASYTKEFTALYGSQIQFAGSNAEMEYNGFALESIEKIEKNENGESERKTISTVDGTGKIDATLSVDKEGLVYNVYYKRNLYTIRYWYTDIDGVTKQLTCDEKYFYGAALNEAGETKANEALSALDGKAGYEASGWVYDGTGNRPDIMPAQDVRVTCKFAPKSATYVVHYYAKSADDGTTYAEISDVRHTYLSVHGTRITFKISDKVESGSSENTEYVAQQLEGYNIVGVRAVNGTGTEPVNPSSTSSVTATVSAIKNETTEETLHVYYFCEPKEYHITLQVWLGSDHKEQLYEATWTYKQGQTLSTKMTNEMASYYEVYDLLGKEPATISKPTVSRKSDSSKDGYVLSEMIGWSTGTAPSTMPVGDITITREYVQDADQEYLVKVHFQKENGDYEEKAILSYYAPVNSKIRIITDMNADIPADDYGNVYIKQFRNLVNGFDYYEFDHATKKDGTAINTETDQLTVVKPGEEQKQLEINIYLRRKTYTINVKYIAVNNGTKTDIATEQISGIWGSCITTIGEDGKVSSGFDPLKYFNVADKQPETAKTYLQAGYIAYYQYDSHIAGSSFWHRFQFETVESLTSWYNSNATTTNYTTNTFATANNPTPTLYVYYTKPDSEKSFGIDVKIRKKTEQLNAGGEYANASDESVTYTGKLRDDDNDNTTYTFRIVNKSQIYTKTGIVGKDYSAYPGLQYIGKATVDFNYGDVKTGYLDVSETLRKYEETSDTTNDPFEYFIKSGAEE